MGARSAHKCSELLRLAHLCAADLRRRTYAGHVGSGVHSWGSRGRRFKSGRPDAGERPIPILDTGLGATDGSADALPLPCVAWSWRASRHPVTDQALLRAAASASRLPASLSAKEHIPPGKSTAASSAQTVSASGDISVGNHVICAGLPWPGSRSRLGWTARSHTPSPAAPSRAPSHWPPSRNRHAHSCEDHAPNSAPPHRLLRVLRGFPACRATLHQTRRGALLQRVSVGVVLVVAAALTPAVAGQKASCNTCGVTIRFGCGSPEGSG